MRKVVHDKFFLQNENYFSAFYTMKIIPSEHRNLFVYTDK